MTFNPETLFFSIVLIWVNVRGILESKFNSCRSVFIAILFVPNKMELIAPWNKESLFLTVSEYNDSDEPVLATASVTKDQPFFNTAGGGVYMAAESFRLSAFAGDLGYIYQMLKPEWFIAGEQRVEDESDLLTVTNLITQSIETSTDLENNTKTQMRIVLQASQQSTGESCLFRLQNQLASYINDYMVTQNSVLKIEAADGDRMYKVVTDPAENIRADGCGDRGLVDITMKITGAALPNTSVVVSDGNLTSFCVRCEVAKSDIPAEYGLEHLKRYFSRGLYLFADTYLNVENSLPDWAFQGNYVLEVLGPYKMLARSTGSVGANVITDPEGKQPKVRCWLNNDYWFQENAMFEFEFYDEGNHHVGSGTIADEGFEEDWAVELVDAFQFKLAVGLNTKTAAAYQKTVGVLQAWIHDHPDQTDIWGVNAFEQSLFYAYDSHLVVADTLKTIVDVELLSGAALDNYTTETVIKLLHRETVAYQGTVSRTLSNNEYPAISPNEMFQIYNGKDSSGEHMWLLNGHANGGFQIQIKKDMDVFRISKDFFDRMGLDPHVICYENIRDGDRTSVGLICIPTTQPDLHGNAQDRYEERNFSNWVTEIDVSQCQKWDGSIIDATPSSLDTLKNTIIRVIGFPEADAYYRLINYFHKKSSGGSTRQAFKKDATLQEGPDGQEYLFTNVSAGDFIQNLQFVSVESFSLFEAIQLCVPSTPFQPMITSYSSGMRVLAELRLDFPVNGSAGTDGMNQGTNDFWVGDIQWSASNGHQYLQLSTAQQSIYNLEVRAQLVYRNCNTIPPKPIWIAPRGGLFQCKIRFVSVK